MLLLENSAEFGKQCFETTMGVRDPFRVLGIDPSASKEDIKNAYRRKVLECHPDRHHGSPDSVRQNAEKQFTVCVLLFPIVFRFFSQLFLVRIRRI